jgi:hypothetical protein
MPSNPALNTSEVEIEIAIGVDQPACSILPDFALDA